MEYEFGLATIERKRIIISQLYKRIELGRGYVVNFEVDWNYKQFIDTLELEQHMGITEVGIPMPPKVRKRSRRTATEKITVQHNTDSRSMTCCPCFLFAQKPGNFD